VGVAVGLEVGGSVEVGVLVAEGDEGELEEGQPCRNIKAQAKTRQVRTMSWTLTAPPWPGVFQGHWTIFGRRIQGTKGVKRSPGSFFAS